MALHHILLQRQLLSTNISDKNKAKVSRSIIKMIILYNVLLIDMPRCIRDQRLNISRIAFLIAL